MSMPDPIRIALADKEAKDQERLLEIASKLDRQGKSRGAEALRLALAAPTSTDLAGPMSIAITSAAAIPPDPSPAAPRPAAVPAMTASVGAAPAADASTLTATVPQPRPRPATSAAPAEPALAKADPQPVPAGAAFLPVPELRTSAAAPEPAVPAPAAPAQVVPPSDAATLEERMLVETAPADSDVANAYASASEEEDGLTGLVLRLFRQ